MLHGCMLIKHAPDKNQELLLAQGAVNWPRLTTKDVLSNLQVTGAVLFELDIQMKKDRAQQNIETDRLEKFSFRLDLNTPKQTGSDLRLPLKT